MVRPLKAMIPKILTAQVLTPNLTQNLIMMTILKINPDLVIILTYPTQNEVFWYQNLYTSESCTSFLLGDTF